MGVDRSRCIPVDVRINSIIDALEDAGSGTTINFQEEGTPVVTSDTLNVVSTIATLTNVGGVATLTITGTAGSQNTFVTYAVSGQGSIVADSTTDTFTFAAGSHITLTTDTGTDTLTIAVSGLNIFDEIVVSGQTTVAANGTSQQLTYVAGPNVAITTDNTTKTVTWSFVNTDTGGGTVFSTLRRGVVTTGCAAGSLAAPATEGLVQLYQRDVTDMFYETVGSPVPFWNIYPLAFPAGYVGQFDTSTDPVEIIVATCTPV